MRTHNVIAAIIALFAASECRAQPEPKAPLDPARVVSQFRKAYHKRPFVESLDITVQTPSDKNRETVTIRANAKGELRLELGDLILWTDKERLLGAHRLNAGTYFETPLDPADRAASLLAALPPLPIPQIALVLQPTTAAPADWTVSPLCREPTWDRAIAASHGKKPAMVLEGSTPTASVRVAGVGDPPVIVFADTKATRDDVTTTISADISRLDEPVGRIECDLRGRERVEHLTDLRVQTPDVRPGLAMPELIVDPLARPSGERERATSLLPEKRTCILLIFTTAPSASSDTADAFAQAVAESARLATVPLRVLAARSITDTAAGGTIERVMRKVSKPGAKEEPAGFVSYSPPTTLARFAPAQETPAVAVLIDGTGLVHAIIPADATDTGTALKAALESLPK